jgi:hypothetical protein
MVFRAIRSLSNWLLVTLTVIYLALGNVPRFLPIGAGKSGILVTELLFYFFALVFFLAHSSKFVLPAEVIIGSLVVLGSYFVGALKSGYDVTALLYGLRFILLMLGSFALGVALRQRYGSRMDLALSRLFVYPLIVSTLIGWALYFLFPRSEQLWLALRLYGIEFAGDPHAHRLLSSYFDPNYYSAIAVFGVVLALNLYRVTQLRRYLMCAIFLVVSIFFSLSRSGIASLAMALIVLSLPHLRNIKVTKLSILTGLAGVAALFFSYPLYSETIIRLMSRFFDTNLQYDGSSLARLRVAQLGLTAIRDNFFLGIGFNYVPSQYETMTAFDSSVMQIIVTMGMIGGVTFLAMFAIFSVRSFRASMLIDRSSDMREVVFGVAGYLIISVVFAALFDNLFFYQFWFVPIFATITYLSGAGQRKEILQGISPDMQIKAAAR